MKALADQNLKYFILRSDLNNKIINGKNKKNPHCRLKAIQAIVIPENIINFGFSLKSFFSILSISNIKMLRKNRIYGSPLIMDIVL